METNNRNRSILLMALCASLWSIAGIFIKMIPWNPLVIAGWRSLLAAGVVAAYMAWKKIKPVIRRSSLLSGALLCLTFLAFVTANKLTTSANAIVLQFTAPIFILIISTRLFRQRFRRADYLVVTATVLGIALCFLDRMTPGSAVGNVIAVLAGFFYGGMYVAGGRMDKPARMSGILLGQLFTAAVGLPAMMFFPPAFTGISVLNIAVLGIFQLGIPYLLYGVAAGGCPPLVACLVSVIEPLLNPIWVFLFDGEAPGLLAIIGEAGVVASVTLWCLWDARGQAGPQVPVADPSLAVCPAADGRRGKAKTLK